MDAMSVRGVKMRTFLLSAALATCAASGANATIVEVSIYGYVGYNAVREGVLNKFDVPSGSAVKISFLLDSTQYMNDPDGLPTRGYFVNQASYAATFNGITVGMQNPFPDGQIPMFVVRDNDPAVDGFFLSTGTAYPAPLPTTANGAFGPLGTYFMSSYDGNMLSSLDIVGAVGTWDYTGLSLFGFNVDDGGFEAMGLDFDHMTIAVVPAPATIGVLLPLAFRRRRR